MVRARSGSGSTSAIGRQMGVLTVLATCLWVLHPARADIFHLKGGGMIDGQKVETEGDQYKIRTTVGIVSLPVDSVERIDEAATPFDEYDRRAAQVADTPGDQVSLANWCEEQGLRVERRKHLLRAVELDGDCAPARRALGYVRVGDMWVDGRTVVDRTPASDASANNDQTNQQRLARAIQGQWYRRIRAIRESMLDRPDVRQVQEGRARILEIRDPLAILGLAQALGDASHPCRTLLIEALSAFQEDEATMNLAAIALVDQYADVRQMALTELARRKDPRVAGQYREALRNGTDAILPRAARGLGCLEVAEAVPDLIDALTARRNRLVEVPVRRYFNQWPSIFYGDNVIYGGGLVTMRTGMRSGYMPAIGVPYDRIYWGDAVNERQWQNVTVLRTEVLEALKRITGQNFGFDRDEWRRWYEESKK